MLLFSSFVYTGLTDAMLFLDKAYEPSVSYPMPHFRTIAPPVKVEWDSFNVFLLRRIAHPFRYRCLSTVY